MTKNEKQAYDRAYHARRSPEAKAEKQRKQYLRRVVLSQFIWDYLKHHPCVDCREDDPVVLEFDHVKGKKVCSVSDAVRHGWSIKRLGTEIKKCLVRCANCHRRKTAKQFGWYKDIKQGVG